MSQEIREILIKRLKSLGWKVLGVVLAAVLAFVKGNISLLNLPAIVTVLVGLVISEITKYYGVNLPELRKAEK